MKSWYFLLLFGCGAYLSASSLDRLIPSEIKDDAFYASIRRIVSKEPLCTILEIGSSGGDGSTEAFVLGMDESVYHPRLYCIELSKVRFAALQERYKNNPKVVCCNVSSVPESSFPSENEVLTFMRTRKDTSLRGFTEQEVSHWLRQDLDYVRSAHVESHGIEWIKSTYGIDHFDMVLIDGSEFTGHAEFALTYGAKWILLDDIRAFKNYDNYLMLMSDQSYELIEQNHYLRNGYAIFKRK